MGRKPESRWIKEIVRSKRRSKKIEKIASVVDCWIPNALYYANSLSILLKYPFYFAFATWHTIRRSFNSCVVVCVYESQAVCLRKPFTFIPNGNGYTAYELYEHWKQCGFSTKWSSKKLVKSLFELQLQFLGFFSKFVNMLLSFGSNGINTLARYDFCIALYRP